MKTTKYKIWRFVDKTLQEYIKFDVPITQQRLAIYERSEYFDDTSDFHFSGILKSTIDDEIYKHLSFERSVSNTIRMSSLINCLSQVRDLLESAYQVVECGAGPTQSTRFISRFLSSCNYHGQYYVFDTFEGHSSRDNYIGTTDFSVDLADFQSIFAQYPFLTAIKGYVPDSFENVKFSKVCFVNLDMNMYSPTYRALLFLWPLLVSQAIVHIDDYNIRPWPGVTKAVDKFLSNIPRSSYFHFQHPLGGSFIIKR